MDQLQFTGKFKLEKGTILKDPLATIIRAVYDYEAMQVVLTVKYENTQFSHVRDLDAITITDTNSLTAEQIKTALNDSLTLRKQ